MRQNNNFTSFLFLVVLCGGYWVYYSLHHQTSISKFETAASDHNSTDGLMDEGSPTEKQARRQVASIPHSLIPLEDSAERRQPQSQKTVSKEFHPKLLDSFRNQKIAKKFLVLMNQHENIRKYWSDLQFLQETDNAVVARIWVAMGLVMIPDSEQAQLLSDIIDDLRAHSVEVMGEVEKNLIDLQKNAFTEQMTLALIHQLQIPDARKAKTYEMVIARPFTLSADGEVTAYAANMTNAMIYLKQTKISEEQLKLILQNALAQNRSNLRSSREVRDRISAYFPEVTLTN